MRNVLQLEVGFFCVYRHIYSSFNLEQETPSTFHLVLPDGQLLLRHFIYCVNKIPYYINII